MTRDDIIRLAREAGIVDWSLHGRLESKEEALKRFAALVAAAEREACAKMCEDIPLPQGTAELTHLPTIERCVNAIRARGV
jgi:predicted TIM-barrel fold metal-dependent hydrolase